MFTWINTQGVKAEEGFILQSMHQYYYHYIENEHVMQIIVEPFIDKKGDYLESVEASSFEKWQPPFESEIVSDKKKEELKKRVSEALKFMKIRHRFI